MPPPTPGPTDNQPDAHADVHADVPRPVATPPELLAPAGDLDCVRAAIANGADAVYFGLDTGFNARARATNLTEESLPETMRLLHRRGLRGYLTLNTLAFPAELPEVERIGRLAVEAGVDAVLVQDIGVVRLLRRLAPELPLHASTQMTLTSAECIAFAAQLGVERVVLPRELSIDEIGDIHEGSPLPLEAFAHGALCVAYSGQCLTSESLGGRSANRGQCAQACRLPYELVCDGRDIDLGPVRYLLSPQDLAAYELVPRLLAAGVVSFKIEGRLKSPEYVAAITRRYREAIDSALAGRPIEFTPRQVEEMELTFSRGFSPGWLEGNDHKRLVPGESSAKRGVPLGEVTRISHGRGWPRVAVRLERDVRPGDGLVFEGDRAAGTEQGGRVYEVYREGRRVDEGAAGELVELTFGRGAIDPRGLQQGLRVWKTDDPRVTADLRKSFASDRPGRDDGFSLDLTVEASVGAPLRITAHAANGARCTLESDSPLEEARRHPLTEELLRTQLGRLGGADYALRHLSARIEGSPMVPLSVLGKLRHELLERLTVAADSLGPSRRVSPTPVLPELRASLAARRPPVSEAEPPRLHVLCRSLPQLDALLQSTSHQSPATILTDFADIREYGEAVRRGHEAGVPIWIATPRIQKPGEVGIFRALLRHGADGVLARNLAAIGFFAREGTPLVGDFSLNAANEMTVEWLVDLGLRRVAASYDLNRDQLLDLVEHTPPAWLEVVIHQHMPMFHMEHCVFCAVLSPGTNKTNCGRPCDRHEVRLRDHVGKEHLLTADVGCRNTLFNATPQSAAEAVPQLLTRGARDFRVELLDERTPAEIARLLDLYRGLLAGERTGREVWTALRAANRVGVTRGTLEERRDPLAIL